MATTTPKRAKPRKPAPRRAKAAAAPKSAPLRLTPKQREALAPALGRHLAAFARLTSRVLSESAPARANVAEAIVAPATPAGAPALGDDFCYDVVDAAKERDAKTKPAALFRTTPTRLHLIHIGPDATHYALTQLGDEPKDPPRIVSVTRGPVAAAIDAATKQFDADSKKKPAATDIRILAFQASRAMVLAYRRDGKGYAFPILLPAGMKVETRKELPLATLLKALAALRLPPGGAASVAS